MILNMILGEWDMIALKKAFEMYPDVKLVVYAELYDFSGNVKQIKEICENYGVLLVEDVAEAMGTSWDGIQCGFYGDYDAVSYNGNNVFATQDGFLIVINAQK